MSRAQVVYYLSHGGRLEQPHLIEVERRHENTLSLIDVKNRLRNLRGKEMPDAFSWAFKRSFKNDYIWNDVSENDTILPLGNEYILKGSENVYSSTRGIQRKEGEKSPAQNEVHRPYSTPKPRKSPKPSSTPEVSSLRVNRELMTEFKGAADEIFREISDDSSTGDFTDVKVYKTPASPITADHGLDAATQTEDNSRKLSGNRVEEPELQRKPDRVVDRVSRRNFEDSKQKPSSTMVLKQLLSCGGIDTNTCPSMKNNNNSISNNKGPSWGYSKEPEIIPSRGFNSRASSFSLVHQDPDSIPKEVVKETTTPKQSPIYNQMEKSSRSANKTPRELPEIRVGVSSTRFTQGARRVEESSPRFSTRRIHQRETITTPALKMVTLSEGFQEASPGVKWAELSPPKKELRCKDDRPLTPGRSRLDWEKSLQEAVTTSTPPADFRQSLQECPQCGRTFKPESLKVHLRGCHGPGQRRQSINVARRLESQ